MAGSFNERASQDSFNRRANQGTAARREEKLRSARLLFLWRLTRSISLLVLYYVVVCLVFGFVEGWPVLDCLYYGTTLMSTVGYGNPKPTKAGTQAATAILSVVGILIFFLNVAWLVEALLKPPTRWMHAWLEKMFPATVVQVLGIDGSTLEVTVPRKKVSFYAKALAPTVAVWVTLQLIFTGLTVVAQPISFGMALYHVIITSTTVGLGDVDIDPLGEHPWVKVVVIAQIFLTGEGRQPPTTWAYRPIQTRHWGLTTHSNHA